MGGRVGSWILQDHSVQGSKWHSVHSSEEWKGRPAGEQACGGNRKPAWSQVLLRLQGLQTGQPRHSLCGRSDLQAGKSLPQKPSGRATTKKPGSKRTTTTRRPNRTTAKGVTSTKKAGLIDRIKDSLGFGGKGSTSSTTTTKSLLSQSGSLLTTKAPTSTTTTRPPFRG